MSVFLRNNTIKLSPFISKRPHFYCIAVEFFFFYDHQKYCTMCRTYHGKYEVLIPLFHWRDWREIEIHPNLESAFVILNILHSMCCNSCFKACQVCLQKHHPWSKEDNRGNLIKRQRTKPFKYRMMGFCRGNLDSLITQYRFSEESFSSILFFSPSS